MSTFTFHNPSGSAYFALEAIPRKTDGIYPTSSNQIYYISGSSFTNVTSSITNPFILNDFKFGVVIPPGTSSFVWGPSGSVEIPASQSRIIGTGMYNMTIGDDAFTYKELYNWTNSVPKITPGSGGGGGGGLATISNTFSMFFDGSAGDKINVSTRQFDIDNSNFSWSTWLNLGATNFGSSYNHIIDFSFEPSTDVFPNNRRVAGSLTMLGGFGASGLAYFRWQAYANDTGGVAGNIDFSPTAEQQGLPSSPTNGVRPNVWNHIAVVVEGKGLNGTNRSKCSFYFNGEKIDSMTGYNQASDYVDFSGFGMSAGMTDLSLDEAAFFTSSLDASTVESIYSASLPLGSNVTADLSTLSTPPVAWYRMGD